MFGTSRQSYYKAKNKIKKENRKEELIIELVKTIRKEQPRIGVRKLYYKIKEDLIKHDIKLGRDKLFDIMFKYNMLIKIKKRRAITTNSNHNYKKYPNLIIDFEPSSPNSLWVTDITYITLENGFCYLSIITDAYSRKIVGWNLSKDLKATSNIDALNMALLKEQGKIKKLIHHSDRGGQYCCADYIEILIKNKITISMTENSDPRENAIAERINGIIKNEIMFERVFKDLATAKAEINKAIKIYNTKRPHLSCEMLTPEQAHKSEGILKKYWKNYRKEKFLINNQLMLDNMNKNNNGFLIEFYN